MDEKSGISVGLVCVRVYVGIYVRVWPICMRAYIYVFLYVIESLYVQISSDSSCTGETPPSWCIHKTNLILNLWFPA